MAVRAVPLALRRARPHAVRAIAFDGACLRGKCEDDPALGYELMRRFARVMVERLQRDPSAAARRLGMPAPRLTAARPGRPDGAAAVSRVTAKRRETADTLDAHARARSGEPLRLRARASSRCSTRSASARSRSRSAATPTARPLVHTVRAVGLGHAGDLRARAGGSCSACAARSAALADRSGRGRRHGDRRRRDRPGAAAPGDLPRARAPRRDYGRLVAPLRRPRPAELLFSESSSAGADAWLEVEVTVDAPDRSGRARRRGAEAGRRGRDFDPAAHGRAALRAGGDDALHRRGADSRRRRRRQIYVSLERNMQCAVGHCGHCQLGPTLVCTDGPVFRYDAVEPLTGGAGAVMAEHASPRWPCGSSPRATAASSRLLDCEDELLAVAGAVEIAYFLEASSADRRRPLRRLAGRGLDHHRPRRRAHPRGPRAVAARWSRSAPARPPAASRRCATSRDVEEFISIVYATPEYISTLATSTPIADARAGRLRAAAAARSTSASCSR